MSDTATLPAIEPETSQGEVLNQHPTKFISPVNSRALQALGVETRLARQELAKIKAELQAMADVKALELSKDSLFTRSERLNKQIEGVNKAMDAAIALGDAKAIQAHAMSLEKLYNLWSLLTGHEKPGVRKSSTKSKTRPQYQNLPEPDTE